MITIFVSSLIFWYLVVALCLWEFNPGTWDENIRSFLLGIVIFTMLITAMIRFPNPHDVTWF